MKKILALLLALVMVLSMTACAGNNTTSTTTTPPAPSTTTNPPASSTTQAPTVSVSFSVVVTDLGGQPQTFQYTSSAATVGEALVAEGLISGSTSEWGLMVDTVNGITASWEKENAYWAFYINGEYAQTGVDSTPLTEGATYSFTKEISYTEMGEGNTTFYFTAKDMDGTVTCFRIHTNETTVGAALSALGLISGSTSEWGMMVDTVNGITASWEKENAYWAFYINGEYAQTGVDSTDVVADATYLFEKVSG